MKSVKYNQLHGLLSSTAEIKTNSPIKGADGIKRIVKIEDDNSLGIYEVIKEITRTEIIETKKVATCPFEEWKQ